MHLSARRKHIALKQPIRVSFGTIAGMDVVEVEIRDGGLIGRGESCPMAIYGESADSAIAAIEGVASQIVSGAIDRLTLQQAMPPGSARNAIDCALWDIEAKRSGRSVWEMAKLTAPDWLLSDVTIGIMAPNETATVAATLRDAPMIKLKLGGEADLECVAAVRSVLPDVPLFVDVNAGWTLERLNEAAPRLADAGVFMIEQPLPPEHDHLLDGYRGVVPLCADESCHDRSDLGRLAGRFDYVNIKLDKTGGLTEALALADAARAKGFRLMVGCMFGSGVAVAPAFVIASLCEVVDLDVPLMVLDPADVGVRHDGSRLHCFTSRLWG